MKKVFSILLILMLASPVFGAKISHVQPNGTSNKQSITVSAVMPDTTPEVQKKDSNAYRDDYVTRSELVQIIAVESGKKPGQVSEMLFSRGLDKPATMGDLRDLLFFSNMLKDEILVDKVFVGKPVAKVK